MKNRLITSSEYTGLRTLSNYTLKSGNQIKILVVFLMIKPSIMGKEEFYQQVINTDHSLIQLFENFKGSSYSELNDYVQDRVQREYVFPGDAESPSELKPLISKEAHERVSIVARTLEEGVDYTFDNFLAAKDFVKQIRRNAMLLAGVLPVL